ncbi:MAG TPA: tetratricopeptide repeat protein [Polyangiaceae bacterium]|nr:tetratricopeptide repeat protein [Polyangiaceae bacterium]
MSKQSYAAVCLLIGCASSAPTVFEKDSAAAERAYSSGRYHEAAAHWHDAAAAAPKKSAARKALQHEAESHQRAGDWQSARAVLLDLSTGSDGIAARASYDLALLELQQGNPEAAQQRLRQLITRYTSAPIAGIALKHYLELIEQYSGAQEHSDAQAALDEIERLQPTLQNTKLDEQLSYESATRLLALGQNIAALTAFLSMTERHPYPKGAYWDDGLWHAALIEEQAGHPQRAIEHLRRMLKSQETSDFVGSYERPRYAQAQFHIAELYRDALHDPQMALKEFEHVWKAHPKSRLVDDALWQSALLKRALNDNAGVCAVMATLQKTVPQSRYVPCAPLLCSALRSDPKADPKAPACAPYIIETISTN